MNGRLDLPPLLKEILGETLHRDIIAKAMNRQALILHMRIHIFTRTLYFAL